nr:RHS repeat-associated core domain-containing protein [Microbacterium hydrocarbonoxydans]
MSGAAMGGLEPFWHEYTYDTKTGNRSGLVKRSTLGAVSTAAYTYPVAGGDRPHSVNTVTGPAGTGPGSYAYDAAGNLTGRPGQTITFNDVGKVSKVVTGAVTQDNVYNVDGRLLLSKSTKEGASLFVGDAVLSQAPGSSVVSGVRTYSGAEGKPIAEKSAKTGTTGTTLTWLFSNLEGTVDVQTVANAVGTTTRTLRDPYGAPIGGSNGVWPGGTGYMNKPVTASTGLTTVGARTYDPVIGKFLSVDPVIDTNLPQQNTGYTYSGNNPTTYMDPTGLRLDQGCGWGVNCTKTYAAPPSYASTSKLGARLIDKGQRTMNSVPIRNPFTVTPRQVQSDLETWGRGYAQKNLGEILKSQQGAFAWAWMNGTSPNRVTFGPQSMITQGLMDSPQVGLYRNGVLAALRSGANIKAGAYTAGAPGLDNSNFIRDMAAMADWSNASNVDRSLAVVGSFAMQANVVTNQSDGSMVLQFTITNEMTLGSAIGPSQQWRELLNSLPGSSGPMSNVAQTYQWTESIP